MNNEMTQILDRLKNHYVLGEEQDTILLNYINQLQSNWNSLREWLEETDKYSLGYFKQVISKMEELEGKSNE